MSSRAAVRPVGVDPSKLEAIKAGKKIKVKPELPKTRK